MTDVYTKTKKTAELYFGTTKEEDRPYNLWKRFDKELAKELSLHITGDMYAREKIPHTLRQFITIAALTALSRIDELKLHIHAALNVGCSVEDIAEVMFQLYTYVGMPAVNSALGALDTVLKEREEEA